MRVIGKGNPQDWPPSPVDLGDGEGGYHCTRWSNSQHAPADPGLNRGDIGLAQGGQLAGAKLPVHEVEQRIDDAAIKVDMFVERIAETVDEADSAETGVPGCIRATFDQLLLNHPQQDVQNRTHRRRIRLEEITQTFRQ